MKRLRLIPLILTLLLVCGALTLAGCKTASKANPAAIAACKDKGKASGDACKLCCQGAGSSGHMWTSGTGCKCLD